MNININLAEIRTIKAEELKPQIQQLAQIIRKGGSLELVITEKGERQIQGNTANQVNKFGQEILVARETSTINTDDLNILFSRISELNLSEVLKTDLEEIQKFINDTLPQGRSPEIKESGVLSSRRSITTDDLPEKVRRPTLIRVTSTPNLRKQRTDQPEEQELRKKDSEMWECVGRKLDKFGGYIYTFRMRKEFDFVQNLNTIQARDNYQKKIEEIFPAIEPQAQTLKWEFFCSKNTDFFNQLGYSMEVDSLLDILCLPDREALLARWSKVQVDRSKFLDELFHQLKQLKGAELLEYWDKIQEKHPYLPNLRSIVDVGKLDDPDYLLSIWEIIRPELPDLDIASGDGIASDIEFVSQYFSHDALLSSGKEFIHDHMNHVFPTIELILTCQAPMPYKKAKFELVQWIAKAFRRIEIAKKELEFQKGNDDLKSGIKKMELTLGLIVDGLSAQNKFELEGIEDLIHKLTGFWEVGEKFNDKVWESRFKDEVRNNFQLEQLWNQMTEIEKKYDEIRRKGDQHI
jgi:hypothetical protein